MKFNRSSGILLHPTSLPSPFGIGDLGPQARRWIDFLEETGTSLWQVLPLGPTGFGDSPYQCFSSFAGNPYLVSPEKLLQDGLIHADDLVDLPKFPDNTVDYGSVIYWKLDLLSRSFLQFQNNPKKMINKEFTSFCDKHTTWLEDYALFMALKESQGGKPWADWSSDLRDRDAKTLAGFKKEHEFAIQRQKYFQFLYYRQWDDLRHYANQKGIRIIGDLPIFIAHDSADAWANRELLYFDKNGQPIAVAGVPPDYFSQTGQLWGNPLYRWEIHKKDGYCWWINRLQSVFSMVDILRLDHFRGFAGYWEVPAGEETAENGHWIPGPGVDLFQQVKEVLGELPFIAEDLGEITPDVIQLRDKFNLPGMKVLVFAFDSGESNEFLPHHYPENCVVYTGTHDNDTAAGWFKRIQEGERSFAQRYLKTSGEDIAWDLIRAAWSSAAVFAIAPLQDLLSLDNKARMNYPGNPHGNWTWRMREDDLDDELKERLGEINQLYSRLKN